MLIDKLSTVSREKGLEISTKKTKVLVASAKATTALVKCDSVSLEQVKSFHYLGSIMSDMCDCRVEITAKPAMARSAAKSLMSLWKDC